MHAQSRSQHQAQSAAQDNAAGHVPELARRLLEANEKYGESNNSGLSPEIRAQARQQARLILENVVARQPDYSMALSLLGRVELDDGRFEQAHTLLDKSLRLEPTNAQCHANMGYWALMTQDAVLAETCFQQALELDRQSASAFCGIAHAKRLQGAFDTAYLHYRKLLDMGLSWPSVFSGMMQCAEQLEVHLADSALARDAIRLLAQDDLPHQNIGGFVTALLRQQYDLDSPHAEVFLDAAASDDLLLLALERTLLPDVAVEELVTLLRRSLLQRVVAEQTLADEYQSLAIALGQYADRTGYALLQSEVEAALINQINADIAKMLIQGATADQLAGSVIVSAMYGALFHQSFASALGRFDLADWAKGMQPVLASSYFAKAEDEAYKQNFAEKDAELTLAPADAPSAWPCWTNLRPMAQRLLKEEFRQTLGIHLGQPEPVRVLLLGCGSGQRALELAHYYTDVEVIAVDESLGNLAHGARRARERGLENVVFWPYSLAQRFVADGHQAQFVELGQMPSVAHKGEQIATLVAQSLATGGLVHINTGTTASSRVDRQIQTLVQAHKLVPGAASIRQLRAMILSGRKDPQWSSVIKSSEFYGLEGCRRRWFSPEDTRQIHDLLGRLGNEVEWRLIKARDNDGHELATGPVQGQLLAEHHGSAVKTLAGQALSLYFQKRR